MSYLNLRIPFSVLCQLIVVPCKKKKKKSLSVHHLLPHFPVFLPPWWLLRQKPSSSSPSPKVSKKPILKSQNIHRYEWHKPRGCHGNLLWQSVWTHCHRSSPRSLMFLFWDIRGYENLRWMVENLTLHLSCRGFRLLCCCGVCFCECCVMCYCIRNPLRDWMLKAKDGECKLDEERCVNVVFPGRDMGIKARKLYYNTTLQGYPEIIRYGPISVHLWWVNQFSSLSTNFPF